MGKEIKRLWRICTCSVSDKSMVPYVTELYPSHGALVSLPRDAQSLHRRRTHKTNWSKSYIFSCFIHATYYIHGLHSHFTNLCHHYIIIFSFTHGPATPRKESGHVLEATEPFSANIQPKVNKFFGSVHQETVMLWFFFFFIYRDYFKKETSWINWVIHQRQRRVQRDAALKSRVNAMRKELVRLFCNLVWRRTFLFAQLNVSRPYGDKSKGREIHTEMSEQTQTWQLCLHNTDVNETETCTAKFIWIWFRF